MRISVVAKTVLRVVVAAIPLACQRESADKAQTKSDQFRGAVRRSRMIPLQWDKKLDGLILLRIDQITVEDQGRVACDSTGIFERTADGHLTAKVVDPTACEVLWHVHDAALSPDGQLLLLASVFESKGSTILNLSDLSQRPLPTKCPASTFAWSPTGDRVAVVEACDSSAAGAPLRVRTLTDTTAAPVLLTGAVGNASWSADGRKIAVARKTAAGSSEIVVLDVPGGRLKPLTRGRDPAWSPNGEWIAYLAVDSSGKASHEIRIMHKDGSRDRPLTTIGAANAPRHSLSGPLVWSHNSAKIAVALAEELWIANVVDSNATPVRVQ